MKSRWALTRADRDGAAAADAPDQRLFICYCSKPTHPQIFDPPNIYCPGARPLQRRHPVRALHCRHGPRALHSARLPLLAAGNETQGATTRASIYIVWSNSRHCGVPLRHPLILRQVLPPVGRLPPADCTRQFHSPCPCKTSLLACYHQHLHIYRHHHDPRADRNPPLPSAIHCLRLTPNATA